MYCRPCRIDSRLFLKNPVTVPDDRDRVLIYHLQYIFQASILRMDCSSFLISDRSFSCICTLSVD